MHIKNKNIYNFFGAYADKNDRISKKKFYDAFEDLKLTSIYDEDKINEFYYYSDQSKNEVVSCNELQKTILTYCQKDINEFIDEIIGNIAHKLIAKDVTYSEFEADLKKFNKSKGKNNNLLNFNIDAKRIVSKTDLSDILNKDHKLDISGIDEKLLFYHYRDFSAEDNVMCDKMLNKIEQIMAESGTKPLPSMSKKTISTMPFSDEEASRIVKMLAFEIEAANEDLDERVYDLDRNGLLTEKEFVKVIRGMNLKLKITTQEVETLVNKYFDTVSQKVQAKQL